MSDFDCDYYYKSYTFNKETFEYDTKDLERVSQKLLKEEEALQKQQLQNQKYKTLPEYEWLRKNKPLYEEQINREVEISSDISYYKQRVKDLTESIARAKSEAERYKQIILSKNPSFDFSVLVQKEQKPIDYTNLLEKDVKILLTYEKIGKELEEELNDLRKKLSDIQSLPEKTKEDQEKERQYITSISSTLFAMDQLTHKEHCIEKSIALTVKGEYKKNNPSIIEYMNAISD